MGLPSCGLRKRTPSSVTFESLSRDTIWKLGEVSYMFIRSAGIMQE